MAKKDLKKSSSKRTVSKWKKKRWFSIIAPPEFDRKVIGETPGEKPELLIGRSLLVNLADLTADRKHRSITITFSIESVQGDNALAETKGHVVDSSYLRRLARRRRSKIEAVQTVSTSDSKKVKVKTVAITSKKVNKGQKTEIGHIIRETIGKSSGKKTFRQFEQEAIFGVLALKIFKKAKKIAPIKRVEIVKTTAVEVK